MSDDPRPWARMATAAAFALAALPACAHAQGVYRIVGPDGRVTYADQPPPTVSPNGRVDVLRAPKGSPSLVPPAPAPAPPSTAADAPPRPRGPARAATAQPRRAAAASTVAVGPEAPQTDLAVEAAVIDVLGIEDVVRRTESICVATQPASARRYSAVVDEWARRNARAVVLARRALARQFDVEKRELLEADVHRRNAGLFDPVVDAAPSAQLAWCERSFAGIAAGRHDVHDKPGLVGPLADLPAR